MAELFDTTAPLMIRDADGTRCVIAECFPHPRGVLYFDLYWHQSSPQQAMHVIEGEVRGEGPWRVGDCVINVLGCHGTDAELAMQFDAWRDYLASSDDYPPVPLIVAIARRMGAAI